MPKISSASPAKASEVGAIMVVPVWAMIMSVKIGLRAAANTVLCERRKTGVCDR